METKGAEAAIIRGWLYLKVFACDFYLIQIEAPRQLSAMCWLVKPSEGVSQTKESLEMRSCGMNALKKSARLTRPSACIEMVLEFVCRLEGRASEISNHVYLGRPGGCYSLHDGKKAASLELSTSWEP
uniref:Uncharacterized protein n=1 Tax=Cannabis sativa TaxID=3483 RepID=A0A803P537_CANSA